MVSEFVIATLCGVTDLSTSAFKNSQGYRVLRANYSATLPEPSRKFSIPPEFEKKSFAQTERDDHDAERRRKGVQAKFQDASSYQIKLHHNETMESLRRSRQLQPVVQEYVDCVNATAHLYERTGRITSRAAMKLVGQEITLKCRDW